jgi:hypothetical protein
MRGAFNPEEIFCPICGQNFGSNYSSHKCPEKVLRSIDGAHRRNPDEEEERNMPEWQRFKYGMELLAMSEDEPLVPSEGVE